MTEEKKWYQTIDPFTLDRIVFFLLITSLLIPFIRPMGLPIPVSEKTMRFYEALESVPPGGRILWDSSVTFGMWYQTVPGEIAFFKHVFALCREKNIKFIVCTPTADAAIIIGRIMDEYCAPYGYMEGLEYGVDYVNLGWIPGGEAIYHGLVADFQGTVKTDYKGTPLSELPITKDIRGGEDFDLLGWSTSAEAHGFMRQWSYLVDLGKVIIVNTHSIITPTLDPYYERGMVAAYLNDMRGGAEYEYLTGYLGIATSLMESQSFGHFLGIAMIIVTAIYFISKRLMK